MPDSAHDDDAAAKRVRVTPEKRGDYTTDGRGIRAWETRRANQFLQAVRQLRGIPAAIPTDELLVLARDISDFLLRSIEPGTSLPRGYAIQRDGLAQPSLSYNVVFLAPSFLDDLPTREVLEHFASDIRAGWLDELAESLGNENDFSRFWLRVRGGGGLRC
jgi:hypothetical protein